MEVILIVLVAVVLIVIDLLMVSVYGSPPVGNWRGCGEIQPDSD